MENLYIEIAIGHPGNRGVLIQYKDLYQYIKQEPLFRSYYLYDEDILLHFKIKKTIRNFSGKHYLPNIILDIDKKTDTDQACLQRTRNLVNRMLTMWKIKPEWIYPFFSGTGYHVVIPNLFGFEASPDLPKQLQVTMAEYFPDADDIYNKTRLIRVPFTPNEKTQLQFYKIPLSIEELLELKSENIKELAQTPDFNRVLFSPMPEKLSFLEPLKVMKAEPSDTKRADEFQPSSIIPCIQKMWHEGAQRGKRHMTLLRLISSFRRRGLPEDAIKVMLYTWGDTLERAEIDRMVSDVFEKNYQYGCFDKLMDSYCDQKCVYFQQKSRNEDALAPLLNAEDMESRFKERVRIVYDKNGFDLNNIFDLGVPYMFLPGEMIIFQGGTGLGKTALVQNIVLATEMETLWLSLEMSAELMYRRFIQIASHKTKEEVIRHYKENDDHWAQAVKHIKLTTIAPQIDKIRHMVAQTSAKILVIDTIDCINVPGYADSMVKLDKIVAELRSIATSQDIIVMAVSHITKQDSRSGFLDEYSGKHSSSIPQKADKVIGIQGNPHKSYRVVTNLKARDEDHFRMECHQHKDTFIFTQISTKNHLTFKMEDENDDL